ncbi:hypothetical protein CAUPRSCDRAFT_10283 [Caulochytrium protostelioides]|uniref:Uncharacterized protein n=1 Tax=Caulochytrium protostelioides TaxID=1555241 RepID=A0A4P9WXA0_9FUNG|nr:hypothetical protein CAUPRSCDRAFT_10283 [Caulochytrium protostelioides]
MAASGGRRPRPPDRRRPASEPSGGSLPRCSGGAGAGAPLRLALWSPPWSCLAPPSSPPRLASPRLASPGRATPRHAGPISLRLAICRLAARHHALSGGAEPRPAGGIIRLAVSRTAPPGQRHVAARFDRQDGASEQPLRLPPSAMGVLSGSMGSSSMCHAAGPARCRGADRSCRSLTRRAVTQNATAC